jgi:hypothetical protein
MTSRSAAIALALFFAFNFRTRTFGQSRSPNVLPTIEQVRVGYDQSVASLGSWWLKYRPVQNNSARGSIQYEWAFDGSRTLHRSLRQLPGKPDKLSFFCTDGKTTWVYDEMSQTQGEKRIIERPFDHEDIGRFWEGESKSYGTAPDVFTTTLGMRFEVNKHAIGRESLSTLLRKGGRVLEMDQVEGHPCWHVDFGIIDSPGSTFTVRAEAWFDPAVGWWPRKIQLKSSDGRREIQTVHTNVSFERAMTDVGSVWFPTAWNNDGWGVKSEWKVDEFKVNVALPAELFRPQHVEGVPIVKQQDPVQEFQRLAKESKPGELITHVPPEATSPNSSSSGMPLTPAQGPLLVKQDSGRPRSEGTAHLWIFGFGLAVLIAVTLKVLKR